jgi:hypothetical protein
MENLVKCAYKNLKIPFSQYHVNNLRISGFFFLYASLLMDGWMDGPWEVIHVVGKRV